MKPLILSSLAIATLLTACVEPPPPLEGEALEARRREIRAEIERSLVDPTGALLGEEAYVLRDPALLAAAADQVMERCEPWMNGDIERLRFFLEGHLNGAREDLLESEAGVRELERLVAKRFAEPRLDRRVVTLPGRDPSDLDRAIAHFGGLVLSGRPSAPLPVPPQEAIEIVSDFGILPSPLELNESGKNNTLPVRFVRHDNPWVDPGDPARPADSVVAKLLLDRIAASPEASRLVIRMSVLPALGPVRTWEYAAEREPGDGDRIRLSIASSVVGGTGSTFEPRSLSLKELESLAARAPK